jgi:uncharacterized membrane protein
MGEKGIVRKAFVLGTYLRGRISGWSSDCSDGLPLILANST